MQITSRAWHPKKLFICFSIAILACFSLAFNPVPLSFVNHNTVHSAGCQPANQRLFTLDGVELTLCLPFFPEALVVATEQDLVQSAYAANPTTRQELSLYAVPFGLQPASDGLPVAGPGVSSTYQELSFKAYAGDVLADFPVESLTLFGQVVPGRTVVLNNIARRYGTAQQMVTQWVLEAGSRVWLLRLTSFSDSFEVNSLSALLTQPLSMESIDLARPSVSLQIASQPVAFVAAQESINMAANLPTPGWWSGDCDVNNFSGSVPLGSSYRGVKTCGPRNTMHLVNFGVGVSQYEWQCVEYVKRYLNLAYGIAPYSANGNTVVANYPGTRLQKVLNGTPNKGPIAGDVISYTGPSTYGHTSLVIASNVDASGNGSITIAEQNYSLSGTRTHTVSNWSISSSDNVYGWLHDAVPVNNPPAGFIKCADEAGVCSFSGTADVVYGALNSFTTARSFTNDVDCNNSVFGNPLIGTTKACYYKVRADASTVNWSTSYFSGSTHWLNAADLTGQMCTESISSVGLDKNYGAASPCTGGALDNWVADYTATVNFAPGNYIFQAQNDDGIKVWVNNQAVFNRAATGSLSAACPVRTLSGNVPIHVVLQETTGNARVRLVWTTDTGVCPLPGAFGKIGPANAVTGQTVSPTISWRASSDVKTYAYCVDTDNNTTCDSGWKDAGVLTSKVLAGLAYSTKYYWQVRSTNVNGVVLADSGAWWSFTTGLDPATCYPLTTSHTGSGNNPVVTPVNGSGCSAGQYHFGDSLTFTAKPASGYRVKAWSGTNNNALTSDTNSRVMPASPAAVAVDYIQSVPQQPITLSPSGKVTNDVHPIYKWGAVSGAESYLITLFNEDLGTIKFENVSVPTSLCTGIPATCSYHPSLALANNNYGFQVAALNSTGSSDFSPWRSFYMARVTTIFYSNATEDGYIRESAENSNVGGGLNATNLTFSVGDSAQKYQYRAILSFKTSSLPVTAVILSATLRLTKQSGVGVNPFDTHGPLYVDLRKGYFGSSSALQAADFSASTSLLRAASVSPVVVTGKYVANLPTTSLIQINKLGLTQMRLYFKLDDDNDLVADYLSFYSGNTTTSAYRPTLEIVYYLP